MRIESRKLEWTTSARTSTIRPGGHQAGGGDKKVTFFFNVLVLEMIFGEFCLTWWEAGVLYLIALRLSRGDSSGTQSQK